MPLVHRKKAEKFALNQAARAMPASTAKTAKLFKEKRKGHWPKGIQPPHLKAVGFQPGQVTNPNGRARGIQSISSLLVRMQKQITPEAAINAMREVFPDFEIADGMTIQEAIHARTCLEAIRGDSAAREFIAERTEGKVPSTFRMGGFVKPKIPLTDEQRAEIAKNMGLKIVTTPIINEIEEQ